MQSHFSPWMKRSFLQMLLLILIISKTIYLIGQHYRLQKNQSIYDKMSAYYMKMDFLKVSKVNGNRINKSRSEEHTSELQSRFDLVCRLLLEKKNNNVGCIVTRPSCNQRGREHG